MPSSDIEGVTPAKLLLAKAFRSAVWNTMEAHPHGKQLHVYEVSEYAEMALYLGAQADLGAAITEDGDLVSVFRHPESSGSSRVILGEVTDVARTLDCFDVNDFLPNMYRDYRWYEVARLKFDPAQQPLGWTEEDGTPDVVLMVNPAFYRRPHPVSYYPSWDAAIEFRESLRR